MEKPYFTQELPKTIRNYLIFVGVCYVIYGPLLFVLDVSAHHAVTADDMIRVVWMTIWMAVVYWCYAKFVQKKNWARIALIVLTFPIGFILLGREARLYCQQSKT